MHEAPPPTNEGIKRRTQLTIRTLQRRTISGGQMATLKQLVAEMAETDAAEAALETQRNRRLEQVSIMLAGVRLQLREIEGRL